MSKYPYGQPQACLDNQRLMSGGYPLLHNRAASSLCAGVILFLVAMLGGPFPAGGATSLSDQQAMVGVLFEYNFAGDAPFYAVSQLPPGLTFDNATRTFTGIPTGVGAYLVDVVGSDGTSAETNGFTLSVEPGIATITLTGTNQAYDGTPKAVSAATAPALVTLSSPLQAGDGGPKSATP